MDPITIIAALAKFAPAVFKWVGAGKDLQSVADKASDIAKTITGETSTDAAMAAMEADPAKALAFQQAVMDQETQFENLYVSDKKDARARDVSLSATPRGNVRSNWLVGFAMLVIVVLLVIVIGFADISEYAKGTISTVLGMFLNELKNIYSFEFGTTRRSREKTDVLDSINKENQ